MDPNKICVGCMEDDSGDPLCPKCGRPFDLDPKNSLQMKPRTLLRDQYMIGRALGHGGFGITYLAWDVGMEERLAIKEYMPSGVAGRASGDTKVMAYSEQTRQEFDWGLDRFLEEARVLKKFSNHPNIVSVNTIFRDNGTAYLVMEYLDGMTFEEFLARRGGSVTFETALRVMLPVMDALATVHSESILHRDISPDNIHLTRNGRIKLIDFGAARNALSQKSRNLSIILKEGYAPEEQYRASGIQGPWTDVYATAATFYHSITGKIPQPSLDRQAEDKVERPSKMGVQIEMHAEGALMKALAVKASDRFQSMEDFKGALTGSIDVAGATKVIDRNDPRVQALEQAAALEGATRPYVPRPPTAGGGQPQGQPTWGQMAQPPRSFAPPPPPQGFQQGFPPPPPAPMMVRPPRPKWMVPGILGGVAVAAIAAVLIFKPSGDDGDGKEKGGGGGQQQQGGGGGQQQGGGGQQQGGGGGQQQGGGGQQQGGGGQQQGGGGGQQQGGGGGQQQGGGGQQQGGGGGQQQGGGGQQQGGGGGQQQGGGGQQQGGGGGQQGRGGGQQRGGGGQQKGGGGGQQQQGGGGGQQQGGGGGQQQGGGGQQQGGGGGQQQGGGGGQQQGGGGGQQQQGGGGGQQQGGGGGQQQQEQGGGGGQQQQQGGGGGVYNGGGGGQPVAGGYDGLIQQAKQVSQRNPYQAMQFLNQAAQLDPSRPQAYNFLGEIELYSMHQLGPAVQHYKAALDHGGEATFHVFHDHGGSGFTRSCTGWLTVSKSGVRFEAFDSLHKFRATGKEIFEAKRNRFGGGQVGPLRIGGGNGRTTTDVSGFHIRLHDSKGENYNLAPMSNYKEAERDLILDIIGK